MPIPLDAQGYARICRVSATFDQKWLKSSWAGWSYREWMSQAERKQAEPQRRVPRTKAGEEITAELTETLASEAEKGYDLAKAKRHRVKEPAARPHAPIATKLDAAPYDDEELTDEDFRAVKEAQGEPGISWSDAEGKLQGDL